MTKFLAGFRNIAYLLIEFEFNHHYCVKCKIYGTVCSFTCTFAVFTT